MCYKLACTKILQNFRLILVKEKFKRDKICYIKEIYEVKFDMKRMKLKPSLVFNWVMFLGGLSVRY